MNLNSQLPVPSRSGPSFGNYGIIANNSLYEGPLEMDSGMASRLHAALARQGNDKIIGASRTTYWHFATENPSPGTEGWFPEKAFFANPPVPEALIANRILVAGTNSDGRRSVASALQTVGAQLDPSTEIAEVRRVGDFWEAFFGKEDFLDNPEITIPRAIITSGEMRNYNRYGGETLNVQNRLTEIAEAWGIPIVYYRLVSGQQDGVQLTSMATLPPPPREID